MNYDNHSIQFKRRNRLLGIAIILYYTATKVYIFNIINFFINVFFQIFIKVQTNSVLFVDKTRIEFFF